MGKKTLFSKKIFRIIFLVIILFGLMPTRLHFSAPFKVNWESINWQVIHSENFDIYFPEGYDMLGKTTLIYAEEANMLLSQKMSHNLTQVIPVFVYPSHLHFQGTNIIPFNLGEGIGGFTEKIKKRVALPFLGSYDDYRHVLTHELVHAFQYDILMDSGFAGVLAARFSRSPPLWLVEGMAEYFSLGWDNSVEMMMRDALMSNMVPSIMDMTIGRVPNRFIFYKGGQAVMRFIAETWGEKKIVELLKDSRDQRNIEEAIRVNFGIGLEEFDKKYQMWIKRRFFTDAEKRFDFEIGNLITRHREDESYMNLHPVLSPDGKKIAYLSIRNYNVAIVYRSIKNVEKTLDFRPLLEEEDDDEEVLVQGGDNARFYQLHLMSNRLSFTGDGKYLFFAIRSQGKDRLILFDIESKKIKEEFVPPLDMIARPYLSPSGKKAVFTGTLAGKTDLFLLDIESKKIERITDDFFAERDAYINSEETKIIFSANRNKENNPESKNYHIFELDLESKKTQQLTFETGKQSSPLYWGQDRFVYVSNQTGISNFMVFDRRVQKSFMMSDVQSGVFEPSFDKDASILGFGIFREQGYDIAIKKFPQDPAEFKSLDPTRKYETIEYPVYAGGANQGVIESYRPIFSPDFAFFGFQYSTFLGFGGFLQLALSDYTGNHSIFGFVDYLSKRSAMNFNLSYGYKKNRLNWYVTAYRQMNYFSIFNFTNIATINDFLYYPTFIQNSVRFGGTLTAEYPLTPFMAVAMQLEVARFEELFRRDFPSEYRRPDVYSNINSLNFVFTYNNVLYTIIGPLTGWHFRSVFEQTMNLSGNDYLYSRYTMDIRRYFHFGMRYILATRVWVGTILGPQRKYFPWQIGGFKTIRGYPFLSMQGTNSFAGNLEFRFPFLDALLFGFPAPWIIQGFSGVAFIDIGSSFYNATGFVGIRNGRLMDLKLSYGLGIRVILAPGLFIKIDWATPWDLKSYLPISRWQGVFSLGYEF